MLQRSESTSIWWPGRWAAWQRGIRINLNSVLIRYLLILVAFCALGCAYLWQASDLSQLYDEIVRLDQQASRLETENIRLAQQSAQWNAPGYIEERLSAEGFVDAQSVVFTRPAPAVEPQQAAQSPGTQ